ncbi:hypothetical protein PIB30_063794, partial [Stylosanthes scabra]|nr:hypothetical protein [Stylosanthes scabra]
MRAVGAVACYPSTVRSRRLSLLCEASLTLCPPVYGPRHLSLRPSTEAQLSTWSGQANISQPNQPDLAYPEPCSITVMPLHRLQARVTKLGDRFPFSNTRNRREQLPMAETESTETSNLAIVSLYSNYLRNRLRAFYPFHPSNLLRSLSNLAAPFRSIHHRQCIPLPIPSNFRDSSMIIKESRVHGVLEDILEHVLLNLHSIEKNLQFWQSKSEKSDARKAYFMVFERGPRACINETAKLFGGNAAQGSLMQNICQSASVYIHERVTVLSSLRYSLATFLAQFYVEVDKIGEELVKDPQNKLPPLLVKLNDMFSTLEGSIGHLHAERQTDSSVDGSYSVPLLFEKLPEMNQEDSQWTDCEIRDAINSLYQNLEKLDSYISVL